MESSCEHRLAAVEHSVDQHAEIERRVAAVEERSVRHSAAIHNVSAQHAELVKRVAVVEEQSIQPGDGEQASAAHAELLRRVAAMEQRSVQHAELEDRLAPLEAAIARFQTHFEKV